MENKNKIVECLRYLIWIRVAAVALSLLSLVPVVKAVAEWLDVLPSLAIIVVLWLLGDGKGRYGKASIYLAISVGIPFVSRLFDIPAYLGMVPSSVCSFVALYQEYNAHAELVEPVAPKVAGQWHSLFNWQVAYLLVAYVVAFVLVILLIEFPMINEIYAWAVQIVNLIYAWFYLRNLDAMRKTLGNME